MKQRSRLELLKHSRAFHGIKHTPDSVRHTQANGQVERVSGTLIPVMQANMETNRTWGKRIVEAECNPNNAYNKTIGTRPFMR